MYMSKMPLVEQSTIEKASLNLDRTTVFAIGVSSYAQLSPLPGVSKDMKLIKRLFLDKKTGVYKPSQFFEFVNPTVEAVRSAILKYCYGRSARGDILIFYFSGHGCVIGAGNFGFCMTDTKMGFEQEGILPLSVLGFREVIQTLAAVDVHPVFIIDACFSGATAHTLSRIHEAMEDDLHRHAAGSYGFLCSSHSDTASIDTNEGGAFTKSFCAIVTAGLDDNYQRHWPILTIKSIGLPLRERLEREGYPLPRCYTGPQLPEIPLAKNIRFRPQSEYFAPYMKRIIEHMWNKGQPREVTVTEIRNELGTGAYANHSKLELLPWSLVEKDRSTSSRRLTKKGKRFAQDKERIPDRIIKEPVSWKWIAAPDAGLIRISDVRRRTKGK